MKIEYFALFFIALLLSACNADNPNSKSNTLEGLVTNTQENEVLYLEVFQGNEPELVDSVLVKSNGKFSLNFNAGLINYYRLRPKSSAQGVMLLLQESEPKTVLHGNLFTTSILDSVQGSTHTQLLHFLYAKMANYESEIEDVRAETNELLQEGKNNEAMQLFRKGVEFSQQYKTFLLQFVEENPSSPSVLAALEKLEIGKNPLLFEKVKDSLASTFGHSTYYAGLLQNYLTMQEQTTRQQQVVEEQKMAAQRISVGKEAPEIKLNNLSGVPTALSQFRGKYVLIDFWASWCGPCRKENPNVKKVYEKFKDKGFEIYAVSLDRNRVAWESAIEADGLPWIHVSDLQFWNSAAAKEYGITAIPYTLLLDPNGIVIAQNLRGNALAQKLSEIFNS
jgi:thiol-disulfide isomerase/thioredoxin